jgi:hypothetical protein
LLRAICLSHGLHGHLRLHERHLVRRAPINSDGVVDHSLRRYSELRLVCKEHVSADGAVAQAGLISAAVLGVTGLIGSTIGGVIADRFLFELSQFL